VPRLDSPEWLILLPAIAFVAWYWRSPRLTKPLRFLALALVVIALAEPVLSDKGRGVDLWVLVDRSPSAAEFLEPRLEEMEELLEGSRSSSDRLFFVDFARDVRKRSASDAGRAPRKGGEPPTFLRAPRSPVGGPVPLSVSPGGSGLPPLGRKPSRRSPRVPATGEERLDQRSTHPGRPVSL